MRRVDLLAATVVLGAVAGCIFAPLPEARSVAHLLLSAAAIALALLLAAYAYHARRHQLLASRMSRLAYPGALAGQPVEFVRGLSAPFVAGLWAPRIFCGDDLSFRLDAEELRGVILHEHHHQRERAPLGLVAVSALAPVLSRTSTGRAWPERERARIEIAADAYAMSQGVPRPVIASALLKLSVGVHLGTAPGFATAADLRVRALLGEPIGFDLDPRVARRIAAACLLIALCLVAYLR